MVYHAVQIFANLKRSSFFDISGPLAQNMARMALQMLSTLGME